MKRYNVTRAEKEAIIKRIAERFRDYVSIAAEDMTRRALTADFDNIIYTDDVIKVTFTVDQIVGDLLVELGALRRTTPHLEEL